MKLALKLNFQPLIGPFINPPTSQLLPFFFFLTSSSTKFPKERLTFLLFTLSAFRLFFHFSNTCSKEWENHAFPRKGYIERCHQDNLKTEREDKKEKHIKGYFKQTKDNKNPENRTCKANSFLKKNKENKVNPLHSVP